MIGRAPRQLLAVLVAVLLSGCLGSSGVRPPLQVEAESLNRRGIEQFARGEVQPALESFRQALLIEQSVENEDGIAINWLNLSLAYQRLGQMQAAEAAVDAVLLDPVRTYPPARLAELALRKATLATGRKDWAPAGFWLEESVRHCPRRCVLAGRQLNLRAHQALVRGEPAQARVSAAAAQRASRDDDAERANALRLLGAADLALGDLAAATRSLNEALAIDKYLRRSDRVYDDLRLLARAATDPGQASDYLERAGNVARAQGRETPPPDATRSPP